MAEEKKDDMETQKQDEGKTQEAPTQKPQRKSAIEEAREARDELKAENDRRERIVEREEEMYAKNVLSGKTDAGDLKLTPEQMQKKQAEGMAGEIVSAFK